MMVASGCATVNFAVDTGVAARYESVGLSGSREKAYMAYRRARPGQARSERISIGRARLHRSLAGLARWEHWIKLDANAPTGNVFR